MREFWIPELIIVIFYLLNILQSPVRRLWNLGGLVWLPPIALLLSIGFFPAYGFRPECVPLLVFGIIFNFFNLSRLTAGRRGRQNAGIFVQPPLFTLISGVLLAFVLAVALGFSPTEDTALSSGVQNLTIRDETRNRDYFLRIYGDIDNPGGLSRPLLLMIPPSVGSQPVVDKLCLALEARGFTVISYARRGFDAPAIEGSAGRASYISPFEIFRRFWFLDRGTRSLKANESGKALEQGRKEDVEFLLSYLEKDPRFRSPDLPLFLAGHEAGGSALILLAGSPGFTSRNPRVKGIIAIESFLWTAYEVVEPVEGFLPSTPGFRGRVERSWIKFIRWFARLKPKELAPAVGAAALPAPELPLLLILSDRSGGEKYREGAYKAILDIFDRMQKAALLVSADGAGPLDFSGFPHYYPLVRALYPGVGNTFWNNGDFSGGGASLMADFASLILAAPMAAPNTLAPGKIPAQGLHTARRAWNLADLRCIVDL
ncbi:hypothetical protein AGMMS49928_10790 [Spirochaetia bacterium]|nr:hypothetical protein AGMMS49928_10790 [Spirochaetia bacterium]